MRRLPALFVLLALAAAPVLAQQKPSNLEPLESVPPPPTISPEDAAL